MVNVADTVKALTDLRHTPASPGVLRRAQMLLQQQQQQLQQVSVTCQALSVVVAKHVCKCSIPRSRNLKYHRLFM